MADEPDDITEANEKLRAFLRDAWQHAQAPTFRVVQNVYLENSTTIARHRDDIVSDGVLVTFGFESDDDTQYAPILMTLPDAFGLVTAMVSVMPEWLRDILKRAILGESTYRDAVAIAEEARRIGVAEGVTREHIDDGTDLIPPWESDEVRAHRKRVEENEQGNNQGDSENRSDENQEFFEMADVLYDQMKDSLAESFWVDDEDSEDGDDNG